MIQRCCALQSVQKQNKENETRLFHNREPELRVHMWGEVFKIAVRGKGSFTIYVTRDKRVGRGKYEKVSSVVREMVKLVERDARLNALKVKKSQLDAAKIEEDGTW